MLFTILRTVNKEIRQSDKPFIIFILPVSIYFWSRLPVKVGDFC